MSKQELDSLADAAGRGPSQAARDLLRFIRKEKLREPGLVMEYGIPLINSKGALGEDTWVVHEQVCCAALDCADLAAAEACITALRRKFPGSTRVKLLVSMLSEARGELEAAETTYAGILDANPANAVAAKRRVATLLAAGQTAKAVAALNDHLEQSPGDPEAWTQLAALHVALGSLDEAAFCYEELVLIAPADPHHHCRLAEVYFTLGTPDAVLRARKHFAQALELRGRGGGGGGGRARALHGLCASCAALAGDRGAAKLLRAEQGGEVNAALHAWAKEELAAAYLDAPSDVAAAVEAVTHEQAALVASGVTKG